MHFMPNNNLEENISHFILIAPTKKNLPPKIAFQILGTQKLHLGNQVPGSRKFSCPDLPPRGPRPKECTNSTIRKGSVIQF